MVKKTKIEVEAGNSSENNISEISDFIFIVREEEIEKDEINLIEKELFKGYICLLNHSMNNETEDMLTIYDKQLNKYLNYNQTNITVPDLKYIGEEGNLCFVKIEFYLSGEIKNYYLPDGFSQNDFVYIEDISELIIPKISSSLFSKNITEEFNELNTLNYTNINETLPKRRLKKKYKKYTISNRNLEEDNDTDLIIEEYLVEPSSESINYDLREANVGQINIDNETIQNFSCLTQFKMNSIESDEVKMEDSVTNTTIYSIIDDEGILQSVEKKTFSSMFNQESDEDLGNNNEEESKNNASFNISSIFIINSLLLNRTEYFKNESLNENLYKYFDNFTYNLYKIEINNSSDEIYEENVKRNLEEDDSYYGLKKKVYEKDLYKYNLLGLNIQKTITNEIIPETGTTNSYFEMILGNKNTKIQFKEQQTNLHIILEKKNKMAYNLISLLKQSNLDLKERNEKYIDIIINIENNISNYFKDYDYSGVFKDSLDDLYKQVSNFSGEVFYELIDLIFIDLKKEKKMVLCHKIQDNP